MDKFRRIFLTLLSLLMIFTSVLPVAAEDTTDINMFSEDGNVVITESEAIIEDNNFQEIEEVPVVIQEGEEGVLEEKIDPPQEVVLNNNLLEGLDFNSKRLIIASDSASIFLSDAPIVSEYDGLYLLQYESIEKAQEAYLYYLDKAIFVEPDVEVIAAEDEAPEIESKEERVSMDEESNPFVELEKEIVKEETFEEIEDKKQLVVALLDSGVNESENVIGRVSMLGDYIGDDNGHGNRMLSYMKEENPDVKVLSVKVLDKDGKGNISSVVAGMEYAIEQGVDIINMSLSARNTQENSILKDYVKKAVDKGIKVVVSAGNNNKDVKWYVPAGIEEAITVGAAKDKENKLEASNFGEGVDFYVIAGSTSEAAARVSALYTLDIDKIPNEVTIKIPSNDINNDDLNGNESFEATDISYVNPDWFANNDELELLLPKSLNQTQHSAVKTTADTKTYHNVGTYGGKAIGVKVSASPVNGGKYKFGNEWRDGFVTMNGYVDFTFEFFYEDNPNTFINMEHAFFAFGSLGDAFGEMAREYVGKVGIQTAFVSNDPVTGINEITMDGVNLYGGVSNRNWVDDPNDDSFAISTAWFPISGASNTFRTYTKKNDWIHEDWGDWEYTFWWAPMTYKFKAIKLVINYLEDGTNNVLGTRYQKGYWAGDNFNIESDTVDWKVDIDKYVYVRNTKIGDANNLIINENKVSGTATKQDLTVNMYYKINDYPLTIKYLNKLNNQPVATQYGPTDTTVGSNYSINSPNVNGYYLVNNAQSTVRGTMPAEPVEHIVYYLPYRKITTEVVNGKIDPNIEKIKNGENKSINYSPNAGYILSEIIVDGSSVSLNGKEKKYDFNNIQANHHIKVVYEKQDPPVKSVKDSSGKNIDDKIVNKDSNLYYTITWKNPTKVKQIYNVTDILPANTEFVSVDNGGKLENGKLSWNNIEVAANATKTVSFVVKALGNGKYIPNTANLSITPTNQPKIDLPSNEVENWTPEITTKEVKNDSGDINGKMQVAGNEYSYFITFKNPSNLKKTYTVTDVLDSNLQFISADNGGVNNNGTVKWVVELDGGKEKTVSVKVKILPSGAGTIIKNKATVKVDESTEITNEVKNPVLPDPIKKVYLGEEEVDGLYVNDGSILTYKVSFENPADEAKEFTVVDSIHENLQEIANISDGGVLADGVITWKLTLAAGEKKVVSFDAKFVGEAKEATNKANVAVDDINLDTNETINWTPKQPDKDVLNPQGEDIDRLYQLAGSEIVYTVEVENIANVKKIFKVVDELPEGVTFKYADNGGKLKDGVVTWENIELPAKGKKTVSVRVVIEEIAKDTVLVNTARQYVDKSNIDSEEVETPVLKDPIKRVLNAEGKDINGLNVSKDQELTYELEVHNAAHDEKEFTFEDTLPEFVKFVSASDGVEPVDGVVTFKKTLKPDETWIAKIVVKTIQFDTYIPNEATVYVDKIHKKTNIVENWVPKEPVKKVINEKGEDAHWEWVVGQDQRNLTYFIEWDNPKDSEGIVKIIDVLDRAIIVNEISHDGVYDEETHTITWEFEVPGKSSGEVSVDITFDMHYAGRKVENKYEEINDEFDHESNVVINYLVDDPTTIDLDGVKTWNDDNNKEGLRPNYIVIELLANGEPYRSAKVSPNKDGEWKYSFTYLPKYMKGEEVVYTVDEQPLDNYAPKYDGMNIVNELIPQPKKYVVNAKGEDINEKLLGVGQEFTYKIEVLNPYEEEKSAEVVDAIPVGLRVLEASDNGKISVDNVLTWKDVKVPAKGSYTLEVKVKVLEKASGVLTNRADVNLDGHKITTNKVYNIIQPKPVKGALSVEGIGIDNMLLKKDDIFFYEISFENPSNESREYEIVDKLPEGVEYVESEGTYDKATHTVRWTKEVAAKTSEKVTVKVKVISEKEGIIVNSADLITGDIREKTNEVKNLINACCEIEKCDDTGKGAAGGEEKVQESPAQTKVVNTGEEGTNLTAMYILSGVAIVLFAILAIILKKKNS